MPKELSFRGYAALLHRRLNAGRLPLHALLCTMLQNTGGITLIIFAFIFLIIPVRIGVGTEGDISNVSAALSVAKLSRNTIAAVAGGSSRPALFQ